MVRRSIPAWAGKPRRTTWRSRRSRVYPRVGGETWTKNANVKAKAGLSPRGRGNPPVGSRYRWY